METARVQSLSEDAQNAINRCCYSAEEMYPTGRIWRYYSVAYRIHRWTFIPVYSTKIFRRERSCFISIWFFSFSSDGWEKSNAKRRTEKSRRSTFGLVSRGNPAQNKPNNIHTTTRLPSAGDKPRVARTLVQRNEQRSVVPKKKEAETSEFWKFPNSATLVMWKMNFKSDVCSSSWFWTNSSRLRGTRFKKKRVQ